MTTFLTFQLQNEVFATNIKNVLEVILDSKISEVPNTPAHIEGVINYRGEIIPIMNFRKKLCFPDNTETDNQIIIFDISKNNTIVKFGAIVDEVQNVIETDKINEKPEFGSKYNSEYIDGIIKQKDKYIMLLNIKKLFADTDTQIISEI